MNEENMPQDLTEIEKILFRIIDHLANNDIVGGIKAVQISNELKPILNDFFIIVHNSAIDQAIEALIKQAEPYDGANWHNSLKISTIKKVLTTIKTRDRS